MIGDTSATRFAMGGAMIFKNIEHYLGEMELGWDDFTRVLDWGCGAGRVTRYLLGDTPCAVTGVDIDADNIAWCPGFLSGRPVRGRAATSADNVRGWRVRPGDRVVRHDPLAGRRSVEVACRAPTVDPTWSAAIPVSAGTNTVCL